VKLENEFTVPAPIEQAWAVLLDVERVAPCLPGAQVEPGGDGGEYTGTMTVKIGPITSRYKGTVKIEQADEAGRVAVMRAQAKDARGQGTAAATITSSMEQAPEGTKVKVVTDMRITGPAAQFGRGVMQDVSAKLMRQFAECLAAEMSATPVESNGGVPEPETVAEEPVGAPADGEAAATPPPPPPPRPEHRAPEVLDLGAASREAVLKRAIPLVAGVVALIVVLRLIRRR
jgi:carbon monoxide dehydrogenase subunit G